MVDVVALGELLIDFTCQSTDGEGYPTLTAHPGGAPANFLATLAKLGASTALLGKVGGDPFGALLLSTLERAGIDTEGMVVDDSVFTTLAFVTLDEAGERTFSFARKPGADTRLRFEELELSLIDRCRVFHFGSLSLTQEPARSATRRAVEYARTQGRLISYDPNLRRPLWDDPAEARAQILWGLGQAHVAKLSDDEVDFLFGLEPREGARHILSRHGPELVFVTCGAAGCWYQTARAEGFVPALPGLAVADTTGAGDIFGGSALWKLLQTGKEIAALNHAQLTDIVTFANTAAGLSVTRPGGIPAIPTLHQITAHLPTGTEHGPAERRM